MKLPKPHLGLRGRIVLLVLVALLPTLALFIYHTRQERVWLLEEAENRALLVARAWAEHHSEYLSSATVLLRATAAIPSADTNCGQALGAMAYQTRWPAEVAFIDRSGRILCSSKEQSAIAGRLDAIYLTDLFDDRSLEISEYKVDGAGRSIAFAGLRLPLGPDGIQTAAVTIIDLAEIERRTEPDAQGMHYEATVLGRNGVILAHHPDAQYLIGSRLAADHPLVPTVNLQIEGVTAGDAADGTAHIFAFTQLPETGAKVVIELPREDVLGAQDRAVRHIAGLLLLVAAMAAVAAWLLAEWSVLRWVAVLGRAAEAFGRRDLDYRAIIPARAGELARLARAFNGMATMLARRHGELETAKDIAESASRQVRVLNDELEHRIAVRTAELVAAQAELVDQERFSAVGQLTSTLAHELRNPLSAAKNTVFTLHDIAKSKGVDVSRPIGRLERSIARCDRIIANLADYTYTGAFNPRPANFDRWLDGVLAEQEIPAEVTIKTDIDALGAAVAMDMGRLQLAIGNVIDNAVQAMLETEQPTPSPRLLIATRLADGLELQVTDNGPGIAPETMARIFDPLFSTKTFGMGLGLPTVRKIVEQHGGAVAVENGAAGVIVTIRLPLAKPMASSPRAAATSGSPRHCRQS